MEYLLPALTVFGLVMMALISPGPDFLCVLRNAFAHGRKIGVITAAGIASGILIHMIYCIAGLAVVVAQSILLFNTLKIGGALYLLYLAFQALRSKGWTIDANLTDKKTITPRQAFVQGFVTNALNPKATLFFLALFTQFIDPHTPIGVQIGYGFICIFTTFFWFTFVAVMLNHPAVRNRFAKMSVWIDRGTGLAFIALAAKLVFSKAPAAN